MKEIQNISKYFNATMRPLCRFTKRIDLKGKYFNKEFDDKSVLCQKCWKYEDYIFRVLLLNGKRTFSGNT